MNTAQTTLSECHPAPPANAPTPTRVLLICSKFLPEYSGAGLRAWRTYQRLQSKHPFALRILCSSMTHFSWRNLTYPYEGVQVTCISSPFKKKYLKAALKRQPLKQKLYYLLFAADEILRSLAFLVHAQMAFDKIHTFGHSFCAGIAAIFAGLCGKPILRELVTMNSRPDDPPGLRWGIRRALQRCGTVIAISPRLAQTAQTAGLTRTWCRPNPVDTQRFCCDPHKRLALRQQLMPFAPTDVVLLDISKFSAVKNKGLLLRALSYLPTRFKLVLAGPLAEPEHALYLDLQAQAQALGITERVCFRPGFIEHPEDWIKASDVFVFASLSDGLGTPVLEALCCGIPVVAHRLAGVTDVWIEEGHSGFLAGNDPRDFAQAVQRAAQLPREALLAAAQRLQQQVNPEAIDAQYLRLLR
jgi:glycosyltransferase involved in cell wall biosynthesis